MVYQYEIINLPKIKSDFTGVERKYNAVIQSSYITDNYIFYIRCVGEVAYLSRCSLPDKGKTIDANNAQVMTLKGFGHTQTLEYYKYKNEYYVLLGCKGVADEIDTNLIANKKVGTYWATQIARIKFKANTVVNYTNCTRLTGLNYAGNKGSIGKVRRVEAALSTDHNYLLLWVRTYETDVKNNKRKYYKTRFSVYNANKINEEMSKVKEGTGISCNDKCIKDNICSGNVFEYSYDNNNGNDDLRYGSNQGLEINNSKEIFVSSEMMKDYVSQGTYIYRLNGKGENIKKYTFKESNIGKDSRCEIEGLQIRNGMMYFAAKNYDEEKNKHFIYKIDISIIG